MNQNLMRYAVLSLSALTVATVPTWAQPTSQPAPAELKTQADNILQMPIQDARQQIGVVFSLADALARAGQDKQAGHYYAQALTRYAWSLDHQLRYAELLKKSGAQGWRMRAELVAQCAETDAQILAAARLLGQDTRYDTSLPAVAAPPAGKACLVLVAMGEVDTIVLKQVASALRTELGIPVLLTRAAAKLPAPARRPLKELAGQIRAQITQEVAPEVIKQFLDKMKLTVKQIKTDDDALFRFYATLVLNTQEDGEFMSQDFLASVEDLRVEGNQWTGEALLEALSKATAAGRAANARYLGVTRVGLIEATNLGLFSRHKGRLAVSTYLPFTGVYARQIPSRKRLVARITKQYLSDTARLWGLPVCSDPRCALAASHSVPEHDLQAVRLCPACRKAWAKAVGQ